VGAVEGKIGDEGGGEVGWARSERRLVSREEQMRGRGASAVPRLGWFWIGSTSSKPITSLVSRALFF
jgi:hypothetical protein